MRVRHLFFLLKNSCFIFHIVSQKRLRSLLDSIVSFLSLAGSNTPIQQCLHDLVNNNEMGRFLDESWLEGYKEAAVERYLHDFVHMVLKPLVPEEEKVSGIISGMLLVFSYPAAPFTIQLIKIILHYTLGFFLSIKIVLSRFYMPIFYFENFTT